jgi:site-specific recombinase XerD
MVVFNKPLHYLCICPVAGAAKCFKIHFKFNHNLFILLTPIMLNPYQTGSLKMPYNSTNEEVFHKKLMEITPAQHQEIIRLFNNHLIATGLKLSTRWNYLKALRTLFQVIDIMNLKKATKEDLEKWVVFLESRYKRQSINVYKNCIKKFYRWLYDMDEGYPSVVKWIRHKNKRTMPKGILSSSDILLLLKSCKSERDHALIHVLYESAGRVGEVLNLKIKDVTLDEYGASVNLDGKTGERRVRLINSVPDLTRWLNSHPNRDNPDYPLWVPLHVNQFNKRDSGKPLNYQSLYWLLQSLKKRSGFKKSLNPHNFRHSRLTELAKQGFMESELRIIAGWGPDSNMPSVYLHISGADIDRKILSKAGVLDENEEIKPDEFLKPIKCPRCLKKNPAESKFCNCGMVLDEKTALEVESTKKDLTESMSVGEKILAKLETFEVMEKRIMELEKKLEVKA